MLPSVFPMPVFRFPREFSRGNQGFMQLMILPPPDTILREISLNFSRERQSGGVQVNAQTSRHLSVSSQAYPPPVQQPYPHLHPELPPRFPRRPPGEAFNSAATSHRSGDECIFHPSGVCSLRSCGPRGVCRDWELRATCRSRHLPPRGLVYRPGKKQRLWVLAPGPRQRCTQAVQKERTGEHWAAARPPAP